MKQAPALALLWDSAAATVDKLWIGWAPVGHFPKRSID